MGGAILVNDSICEFTDLENLKTITLPIMVEQYI